MTFDMLIYSHHVYRIASHTNNNERWQLRAGQTWIVSIALHFRKDQVGQTEVVASTDKLLDVIR